MEADETRHERVDQEIERLDERLWSIARALHAAPEPANAEHEAVRTLTGELAGAGFTVTRDVAGLPTAFTARHGEGRPCVALLLEYDAVAGLGHASGRNLVAAAGLGAALAARAVAGDERGSILVVGCPAAEPATGKVTLANAGVFDDVDAALVFHPGTHSWTWAPLTARTEVRVIVHGRAAHPTAEPRLGVDAVAALVQTFTAVAALQARLPAGTHVQGIITRGGESTDVVPGVAEARFGLSAPTTAALDELVSGVTACAEGSALATVAKAETDRLGPGCAHFRDNPVLSARFTRHLTARGIHATPPDPGVFPGSSDVGDVSLLVPTIHPFVAILDPGHAERTPEFTAAAASPRARAVLLAAAAALGRTTVDLLAHQALVSQAWDLFSDQCRTEQTRTG
ncbi:peptidase dimerization domain-containing protein [Amycolatopsis rhabdoformis]|uniref:Peptidase M20 domain-containing protein 2 n=1 Tax=Amycolatopsis rhabdoformis TaxID=1448059 RepID=A0ABZ1IKJ0_9PSEU|nr:peptidase dimerization domain-containing protein [Amycolatopsis rhabdoformis]WSE34296.1 peptidase dimerization domain-containing protein [Amycolatopsis rhabdoformis]